MNDRENAFREIKAITDYIFCRDRFLKSAADRGFADAIFVPGDMHPYASENAAALWKRGVAPVIVISGSYGMQNGKFTGVKAKKYEYDGDYKSEVEFMLDVLVKNGVDESAVISESNAKFTKENGTLSRKVCDERGIFPKTAVICCKSFHARRCLLSYASAFPETAFYVSGVPVYSITAENWYTTEYGVRRVMGELKRCGEQFENEIFAFGKKL